jgi:hypothetical protein
MVGASAYAEQPSPPVRSTLTIEAQRDVFD